MRSISDVKAYFFITYKRLFGPDLFNIINQRFENSNFSNSSSCNGK